VARKKKGFYKEDPSKDPDQPAVKFNAYGMKV